MDSRDDKIISQKPTDYQISYADIYQYTQANSSSKIKDSIQSTTPEAAQRNLEIIESYERIYCRSNNTFVNHVAFEACEWGAYYGLKGISVAGEVMQGGGSDGGILVGALAAVLCGGVAGTIAGGAHAIYTRCRSMLLDEEQKLTVLELKTVAKNRSTLFFNLDSLSSNTKQIFENNRFNRENELVSILVVKP